MKFETVAWNRFNVIWIMSLSTLSILVPLSIISNASTSYKEHLWKQMRATINKFIHHLDMPSKNNDNSLNHSTILAMCTIFAMCLIYPYTFITLSNFKIISWIKPSGSDAIVFFLINAASLYNPFYNWFYHEISCSNTSP